MRDPAWRSWFRAQFDLASVFKTGDSFEDFTASILKSLHDDYINPAPTGTLGDYGSDGVAEGATVIYACFGSRSKDDSERGLLKKIQGDFERAHEKWPHMREWRFVTNAKVGALCAEYIGELQRTHEYSETRPIKPRLWKAGDLWFKAAKSMTFEELDDLFPGCPRAQNVQLEDLIPLLDRLNDHDPSAGSLQPIRPVPANKMEFNALPPTARIEITEMRIFAPRIDQWFEGQADPDLRDNQGAQFRAIYVDQLRVTSDPGEILERIYTALGGSDFRHDRKRANAVYAVSAYYFDRCHIFEEPPADYVREGDHVPSD